MEKTAKPALKGLFSVVAATALPFCALRAHAAYTEADDAAAAALGGAAGGDEIRVVANADGTSDIVHIFTNATAVHTFSIPQKNSIKEGSFRILAVGGGGSGGSDCGGGGGAGGYIDVASKNLAAGDYFVYVGAGGAGWNNDNLNRQGLDGESTAITNALDNSEVLLALGGGGGGSWSNGTNGRDGGSGGGGKSSGGAGLQPSSVWGGLGNAGGTGSNGDHGGGGGGAGGAGVSYTTSGLGGNGGAGVMNDITGEEVCYAFGGGGRGSSTPGVSGDGDDTDGYGDAGNATRDGQPGKPGTGSGGGGGGTSPHRMCGDGGSGIVAIRYTVGTLMADGSTLYAYKSDGDFLLSKAALVRILAVGGGGAGGSGTFTTTQGGNGGGGAGGFVDITNILYAATHSITIGEGGAVGTSVGGNGGDTLISTNGVAEITALGGGGGGNRSTNGSDGGSGGGGSRSRSGGKSKQAEFGYGVGYDGASVGSIYRVGGGGGGAGGTPDSPTVNTIGGNGGPGAESDITGTHAVYAAGGGGGSRGATGGTGGSGIGGNGGGTSAATSGAANTGSGGGGGTTGASTAGAGGSGIVYIRVIRYMPVKPAEGQAFPYDGMDHSIAFEDEAVTVAGTISASAVGTYATTFTLNEVDGVKYVWSDGTAGEVTIEWSITPPELEIESFTLAGWQTGEAPNDPVIVSTPAVSAEEVTYYYSASADGPWDDTEPPSVSGTYYVKAYIESDNFIHNHANDPVAMFTLWDWNGKNPSWAAYHADITDAHYTGASALTDFPVLVRVSDSAIPGFYSQCQADGSDIRFTDAEGNVLAFELNEWNPSGTSSWWVKVPEYKAGAYVATIDWGTVLDAEGNEIAMPENDPSQVWSGYIAVWHMDGLSDATGHGFDLYGDTGNAGSATDSVFGGATYMNGSQRFLRAADYEADYPDAASNFTYTAWYKAPGYAGNMNFAGKRNMTGTPTSGGWHLRLEESVDTTVRFLSSDASVYWTMANLPGMSENWNFFSIASSPDQLKVFVNSASRVSTTTANHLINANVNPLTVMSSLLAADEVRIAAGKRSDDWVLAEYQQANVAGYGDDDTGFTFGNVFATPDAVLKNRWIEYPIVTPALWPKGGSPDRFFEGLPAYGTPWWTFANEITGVVLTNSIPVDAGDWKLDFTVDSGSSGTRSWPGLKYDAGSVSIYETSPYKNLDGTCGTASASGRVLLANDDSNPDSPVEGQAYWLTNATESATYWVHGGEEEIASFSHITAETSHLLCLAEPNDELCGSTEIWRLENARIGNTYPANVANYANYAARVYLPYSSTAGAFTSEDAAPGQGESAHIALRNIGGAVIYSPCYTNGIGTIYFDAANARTSEDGAGYGICVEVATVATNAFDYSGNFYAEAIPTDEFVHERMAAYDYETDGGDGTMINNHVDASTNYYVKAKWEKVEVIPLKKDGTDGFVRLDATNTVNLAISNGGTLDNFYRIIVPALNYRGPVRFRIRRTEVNETYAAQPDGEAFILLDNIVVSYPAMKNDFIPYGKFDPDMAGDETLGWENAFMMPFPSVTGDGIYARGVRDPKANPGKPGADPEDFTVSAWMHYRWRYLDQEYAPQDGWKKVRLPAAADFRAQDALELPAGALGDVEFWYESTQNAPYYDYCDYSGKNLGAGGFSEEILTITNAYWNAGLATEALETGGTNWFVRLRNGSSDFEAVKLVVRTIDEEGTESDVPDVAMRLSDDNTWRGFVKTVDDTNSPKVVTLKYRVEALNAQIAGSEEFATNILYLSSRESADKMPVTVYMDERSGTDDWATVPCDFATGYFLFQLDTATRALSIVHADYQNFNAWNDAKGSVFVGSSTEDSAKSGASSVSRAMNEDFSKWGNMAKTNPLWEESFVSANTASYAGENDYTEFNYDVTTENGWTANGGMWVNQYYRHSALVGGLVGRAFQMKGQGVGSLQFSDAAQSPRGLDTISFTARVGQSISLRDFCYYDAGTKATMSNYTFCARANFDTNSCNDFCGNASLSLIANFRPDKGCYEFRFEQETANVNSAGNVTGIARRGQYLKLYRWNYVNNKLVATQLTGGSRIKLGNPVDLPYATSMSGNFIPMFISVSNATDGAVMIMAGIRRGGISASATQSGNSNTDHAILVYRDTSSNKLKSGTYGLLSANCPAVFNQPYFYDKPATIPNNFTDSNSLNWYSTVKVTYNGSGTTCRNDIADEMWYLPPGRMEAFIPSSSSSLEWGIRASTPREPLAILTAPPDSQRFSSIATTNITSFGTAGSSGTKYSFPIRSIDNCIVKIADAAESDDTRADIVIDDVVLSQWRGDNWNDTQNQTELSSIIPNWSSDDGGSGGHTNFLFTSAWVTNNTVLLSARRTAQGTPCSIRSPLFDGMYNRGIGLGMMAFEYANAQENVNLLLQIATNGVTYANVNSIDDFDALKWTTVTNFSFSGLSAQELAEGTRSCYLGLHGAKGVMRLVMDPAVVSAVAGSSNPSAFGDIYIKSVYCRDEPVLDASSWWGWNLRTVGQDAAGADSEKKMFLYDQTRSASKVGLSLALNNSVDDGIDQMKSEEYLQHIPFLQTPTFSTNVVGEVSFRARKYDLSSSQPAQVTLYGSETGSIDGKWTTLARFIVSNTTYQVYSHKTDPNDTFAAFRLGVTGVSGVRDTQMDNRSPEGYDTPVRVLLDEVAVFEAIRARIGFKNVGTIRNTDTDSALDRSTAVAGVPDEKWQPLCNESWGVQCEIYPAQLGDEIDFTRAGGPTVWVNWFNRDVPWGYDNWKDMPAAKRAVLSKATDSNMVYKASYLTSPDAVIPLSTAPGQVVQYMLEVVYYVKGSDQPLTNRLMSAEWTNPAWYAPVDKNNGAGAFSAYTILDSVAPHWAWINEVNIFGEYDRNYDNSDAKYQYVEIAVPQEADITGWKVELLEPYENNEYVVTNVLGVFGSGLLSGTKSVGAASNMTFRVLANNGTWSSGNLKYEDGTLDGVWTGGLSSTFPSSGVIHPIDTIGLRLVRTSGVVEHEIVVRGLDWFKQFDDSREGDYTNAVNYLNTTSPLKKFFWVGDDDNGVANSLGVYTGSGVSSNEWNKTMIHTPGRINEGQTIDPDHPTPNGSSILVYANVDILGGHIVQTVGDGVDTAESQIIVLKKGSERGTNITYRVDSWYELGNVTTNGRATVWRDVPGAERTYEVTVGLMASNNITVNASATVASNLVALGITDSNRYKQAIMKWLETGKDAHGRPWRPRADLDSGEVKLAKFIPYHRGLANATDMTLTQMYWLDMDPTAGDLALEAGVSKAPGPVIVEGYEGSASVTNTRMGVYMAITNLATGARWAPYIIRGVDYGITSWDYSDGAHGAWTSATFKVIGILANGLTSESVARNRIPLRWFVFSEDSFDPDTCTSTIDVDDPWSDASPMYYQGLKDWYEKYGTKPSVFYGWDLDDRIKPIGVEIMQKENYLDE